MAQCYGVLLTCCVVVLLELHGTLLNCPDQCPQKKILISKELVQLMLSNVTLNTLLQYDVLF